MLYLYTQDAERAPKAPNSQQAYLLRFQVRTHSACCATELPQFLQSWFTELPLFNSTASIHSLYLTHLKRIHTLHAIWQLISIGFTEHTDRGLARVDIKSQDRTRQGYTGRVRQTVGMWGCVCVCVQGGKALYCEVNSTLELRGKREGGALRSANQQFQRPSKVHTHTHTHHPTFHLLSKHARAGYGRVSAEDTPVVTCLCVSPVCVSSVGAGA